MNENLLRFKKMDINSFFFSPPNTCVFTTRAALLTRTYLSSPQKEGFLLGDVKGEAKNSITDSQMDDVEVVYTIGQCTPTPPLTAPCSQGTHGHMGRGHNTKYTHQAPFTTLQLLKIIDLKKFKS